MLGAGGRMRSASLILLIWLSGAAPGWAGAWLREEGRGFLSLTGILRGATGPGDEFGLYADYGLAPRLTLGLEVNATSGRAGHALGFIRLPLGRRTGHMRYALELGLGGYRRFGTWRPMVKSTLSAGRGFGSRWGPGWLAADAAIEYRRDLPDPTYKLDMTLGLSPDPGPRPMLQLETAYLPGAGFTWSLTPALLVNAGKRVSWVAGFERKSANPTGLGLKLGLWRRF